MDDVADPHPRLQIKPGERGGDEPKRPRSAGGKRRRIARLAQWVPHGACCADVGTDHALLPELLLRSGRCRRCVAIDLAASPLRAAASRLQRDPLAALELRRGDGLAPIAPGEVDCVVVAGLGGPRIAAILERGGDRLAGVRRLVLQPLHGERTVRIWLRARGFDLVAEELVECNHVGYEILVAEPGDPDAAYRGSPLGRACSLLAGPRLLAARPPSLLPRWEHRLRGMRAAIATAPPGRARRELRLASRLAARVVDHLRATSTAPGGLRTRLY